MFLECDASSLLRDNIQWRHFVGITANNKLQSAFIIVFVVPNELNGQYAAQFGSPSRKTTLLTPIHT